MRPQKRIVCVYKCDAFKLVVKRFFNMTNVILFYIKEKSCTNTLVVYFKSKYLVKRLMRDVFHNKKEDYKWFTIYDGRTIDIFILYTNRKIPTMRALNVNEFNVTILYPDGEFYDFDEYICDVLAELSSNCYAVDNECNTMRIINKSIRRSNREESQQQQHADNDDGALYLDIGLRKLCLLLLENNHCWHKFKLYLLCLFNKIKQYL